MKPPTIELIALAREWLTEYEGEEDLTPVVVLLDREIRRRRRAEFIRLAIKEPGITRRVAVRAFNRFEKERTDEE